jgi:hypothetical protein
MARVFTNYTKGTQIRTECINHMTTTTISKDYNNDGAIDELMRQLDMGDITDVTKQFYNLGSLKRMTGDILFKNSYDISYALAIHKFIERADYYQITFSLYKSI